MPTFNRDGALAALRSGSYDVVVIGAGMTGAGVALDAAARGLKVALIDQGDISSGTSSKSSKMVHGGLRYLQQREFRLVYENLRERQRLLDNAPFLVQPLSFLIPLFGSEGVVSTTIVKGYSTALRLYDITGGWRIGQRYRRVSRDEALELLPTLNANRLVAGFIYHDARGDDARVALTLAKTAALDFGADVANHVRATGLEHDANGRVTSVACVDTVSREQFDIATRLVVNAAGVWADQIFEMTARDGAKRITPAKGVHVSVARDRLPASAAAILNVPGDRRSIFVVPFDDAPFTFIGTTDTAYDDSLDEPLCTPEDVAYLLSAVNASTSSQLTAADVTGVWAGLRPLLASAHGEHLSERTADLSRRHRVTDTRDGVIHVTGGKWTTYRQMAEDAMDAARPYFERLAATPTKKLRLHGSGSWRPSSALETHLYHRYGDDARALLELIRNDESLGNEMIKGQPYVGAEFVYAVRQEMAVSLIDILTRRTRAHLHDARSTLDAAEAIADLVASDLHWSELETARQVADYRELVEREFGAAGLTL